MIKVRIISITLVWHCYYSNHQWTKWRQTCNILARVSCLYNGFVKKLVHFDQLSVWYWSIFCFYDLGRVIISKWPLTDNNKTTMFFCNRKIVTVNHKISSKLWFQMIFKCSYAPVLLVYISLYRKRNT